MHLIQSALIIYFTLSLPISLVLLKDKHVRFVFLQTLTKWYSKKFKVNYIFIGDSIVAGGKNWSNFIKTSPFSVLNLGGNGYTTKQIYTQAMEVVTYKPKYCILQAGTNDVFMINDSLYDVSVFESHYNQLLTILTQNKIKVICNLIPYQFSLSNSELIGLLNTIIIRLCDQQRVEYIDMNTLIATDRVLLKQYTTDGIHFSQKAYKVWGNKIREKLAN